MQVILSHLSQKTNILFKLLLFFFRRCSAGLNQERTVADREVALSPTFPLLCSLCTHLISLKLRHAFNDVMGARGPSLRSKFWAACQGPLSLPSPSSKADCVMDYRQHQEGTTLHHQYIRQRYVCVYQITCIPYNSLLCFMNLYLCSLHWACKPSNVLSVVLKINKLSKYNKSSFFILSLTIHET